MSEKICAERRGCWGVVTLNAPEKLNALDFDMVRAVHAQLDAWARDDAVRAVLIRGAGERAFCAGADIRWLYEAGRADPGDACAFYREEYLNNSLIYHYPKPYVALIDGIVMGGGVGLSVHGDFRVAGDRTEFAMPETAIGFFPDVGGAHFLPRLHDGLGVYYGLTGARAGAADVMAAGIATHFIASDEHDALADALTDLKLADHPHGAIEAVLDDAAGDPGHAPINDVRGDIARLFEGRESLADLVAAVEQDASPVAASAREAFARVSPTSLAITFEQLRRGHELDFDAAMKMEFRIARRVMAGEDYYEGVRAQIIDKDRQPRWRPARIEDVRAEDVAACFAPLGAEELVLP